MLSRKVRSLHLNPISSKWPLNWAFERCHFSVLARTGDERSTDAAVVASTSRQGGLACSRLSAMRFFSSNVMIKGLGKSWHFISLIRTAFGDGHHYYVTMHCIGTPTS